MGLAMKMLLAALLAPALMLSVPPANVGSVTVYGVQKQVQTEKMHFDGVYPQFNGVQDKSKQTDLNNQMREWMNCALARAKAAVLTLPNGDGPERVVEGIYYYEVKRNSGGTRQPAVQRLLVCGRRQRPGCENRSHHFLHNRTDAANGGSVRQRCVL